MIVIWSEKAENTLNETSKYILERFGEKNMGVCVKKRPGIALKMLYVSKRDLKQA